MLGFLRRNNPLAPLEKNLANSEKLLYRLYLYVRRQWANEDRHDVREVYTLVGANMSVLRAVTTDVRFDERFRFGGEDLDISLQLRRYFPEGRLVFTPQAVVWHHFEPTLRDTLRRSRAYGRGGARLYLKWPALRPTILPGPALVFALVVASSFFPYLLAAAAVLPLLMYPKGIRHALSSRRLPSLLDPYVQLAQESYANTGYLQGLWQYRGLEPESAISVAARGSLDRQPSGIAG
jgi:GT2 family glycosyltransferase